MLAVAVGLHTVTSAPADLMHSCISLGCFLLPFFFLQIWAQGACDCCVIRVAALQDAAAMKTPATMARPHTTPRRGAADKEPRTPRGPRQVPQSAPRTAPRTAARQELASSDGQENVRVCTCITSTSAALTHAMSRQHHHVHVVPATAYCSHQEEFWH